MKIKAMNLKTLAKHVSSKIGLAGCMAVVIDGDKSVELNSWYKRNKTVSPRFVKRVNESLKSENDVIITNDGHNPVVVIALAGSKFSRYYYDVVVTTRSGKIFNCELMMWFDSMKSMLNHIEKMEENNNEN